MDVREKGTPIQVRLKDMPREVPLVISRSNVHFFGGCQKSV